MLVDPCIPSVSVVPVAVLDGCGTGQDRRSAIKITADYRWVGLPAHASVLAGGKMSDPAGRHGGECRGALAVAWRFAATHALDSCTSVDNHRTTSLLSHPRSSAGWWRSWWCTSRRASLESPAPSSLWRASSPRAACWQASPHTALAACISCWAARRATALHSPPLTSPALLVHLPRACLYSHILPTRSSLAALAWLLAGQKPGLLPRPVLITDPTIHDSLAPRCNGKPVSMLISYFPTVRQGRFRAGGQGGAGAML